MNHFRLMRILLRALELCRENKKKMILLIFLCFSWQWLLLKAVFSFYTLFTFVFDKQVELNPQIFSIKKIEEICLFDNYDLYIKIKNSPIQSLLEKKWNHLDEYSKKIDYRFGGNGSTQSSNLAICFDDQSCFSFNLPKKFLVNPSYEKCFYKKPYITFFKSKKELFVYLNRR